MVNPVNVLVKPWKSNFTNCFSWRTNRMIVVIESDDWGSIRMPSKSALESLFLNKGVKPGPYERFDALERRSDLEPLFETLTRHRDLNGRSPVITANTVVANPDFSKIRENGFTKFEYEPFTKTYERYQSENVFNLIEKGIDEKLYFPQFHGREHVNAEVWLHLLRSGNKHVMDAFNVGTWSLPKQLYPETSVNIQASFDGDTPSQESFHLDALQKGLKLFEKTFHFRSRSFIANNFTWSSDLNKALHVNGVDILQGMVYQKLPRKAGEKRRKVRHHTGERNDLGQTYLVRNCVFEPAQENKEDVVTRCLYQVANAFLWKAPAIITTHRLNFIGSINKRNQDRNLRYLDELLKGIRKNWPEVEFMNSVELAQVIINEESDAKL